MMNPRYSTRAILRLYQSATVREVRSFNTRVAASPYATRRQQHFTRSILLVAGVGSLATTLQWLIDDKIFEEVHAEEPVTPAEIKFEPARKKPSSKEENRDIISSQHLQVKKSWENPGIYAWGSNSGRVVAPESSESFIKTPRRLSFFDGLLLRDLKLDRKFGAAITDKGDLMQWGTEFSPECKRPVVTLKGKNLESLAVSRDRIIALSKDGKTYSVPVSQSEQEEGPKPLEETWIPFWKSRSSISYRRLQPKGLGWGEKVSNIAGGLEHVLLLTSKGRLFSAASGSEDFPNKGQLGIPGLTWTTRPQGPYDMCHEISTLRGFNIKHISAGDYHSLAADSEGRVFSFGDNSHGQLGLDFNPDFAIIDVPSLIPIQNLYAGTDQVPRVTGIAAGGKNSYFTVDATKIAGREDDTASTRSLGKVTADTWSCGQGIWGSLGNGRWTHVQGIPTKIPALSGLFEYDERTKKSVPIRLSRISVGATHASAVMGNVTSVHASERGTENDINWGADILFFGNNEFYQLGTGKRNNVSHPTYIQPLDFQAERQAREREEHRFQLTPRKKVNINGRSVSMEQRVECGRGVTAVYSGV
ncbi:mitochondrial protein-like protein Fmp25 [Patellaria atrata CBS 101060]|uniref:Mitochondrial protein-like protein Fmp25 n=1 Tax=Patellaria atrata CBS 101060 TaxID=1346257 RepID=A0A9P4VPU9_9PEZI|nr:mitochondrial protein-like protein Fmp25 [Patellaria atrata CBS 101060]